MNEPINWIENKKLDHQGLRITNFCDKLKGPNVIRTESMNNSPS